MIEHAITGVLAHRVDLGMCGALCTSRARENRKARKLTAWSDVRSTHARRTRLFPLAAIAGLLTLPSVAAAQRTANDTTPCAASLSAPAAGVSSPRASLRRSGTDTTAAAGPVDVVIYAAATAREVKFATQPDIRVRLCGGLDSIHVLERRNLPSPVVAGTTYRNVYVAVQIFGRLNAECLTRTLTGGRAADSTQGAPPLDCASLELRSTSPTSRPPADSGRPPRR